MNENSAVRLGVIGLGNIAGQHIANIRSGQVTHCKISALCSRSPSELADQLDVPHFNDVAALVDSGTCDAVLIATPTCHHLQAGTLALQAGLHVMMEKPLGLSVKEGKDLLATQSSGQVFALMLNQRTDPLFLAMRDIIASGALGDIVRTHWTMTNWFRPEVYFQVSDWRATWRGEGGGLLLNQCIHNLDIYQWLCGMPSSVRAQCRFGRYHDIEVEDEVTALLHYPNGASGMFIGSTGEAPGVNRFDIIGDAGALYFDGERLSHSRNEPSTSEFNRNTREMFGTPAVSTIDITPERDVNQHAAILSNFTAAILHGEDLIAPASEGQASLSLANAMLLSTWDNQDIPLPLDSAVYQLALERKLATSALRNKLSIETSVDMDASYR